MYIRIVLNWKEVIRMTEQTEPKLIDICVALNNIAEHIVRSEVSIIMQQGGDNLPMEEYQKRYMYYHDSHSLIKAVTSIKQWLATQIAPPPQQLILSAEEAQTILAAREAKKAEEAEENELAELIEQADDEEE